MSCVIQTFRCKTMLVICLVLVINSSLTSSKGSETTTTLVTAKRFFWGKRRPNQHRLYNGGQRDDGSPICYERLGCVSLPRHHNVVLTITRGGGDTSKLEGTSQQHSQGNDEVVGNVIGMAYRRLEKLEEKMQEVLLDQSSNRMPLLEFGSLVQDILHTTDTELGNESGMNKSFRRGLMKGIIVEVQRLYNDQLQALRNHYGQRYESVLDEEIDEDVENDIVEQRWATAAQHLTQAFECAAKNAIPEIYQTDAKNTKDEIKSKSEVSFDYVNALQGLIRDMIESTERRKEERNVATIIEEDTSESISTSARKFRLPEVPKWVERLAARAFVFGVNYFQGWLAWQGIKRAALERDRNQPKFPLF